MTPVYYILGVLIFVVALLASVGLHECGHMVPAKRFGARVPHFFIGFGKTLWSRQKGDTLYGIKALPLGGYVKIVGMFPPSKDGIAADAEGDPALAGVGAEPAAVAGGVRLRQSSTGMFTQLISDARAAEWEWVRPEDTDRLFYKLSWWKKVVVMAGGPTVNLVIAFLIFGGVFATYGNPSDRSLEPVVSNVSGCVVPVAEEGRKCTAADPKSPALVAGLQEGDRLLSFNGDARHLVGAAADPDPRQRRRSGGDRRRARRLPRDPDHQHPRRPATRPRGRAASRSRWASWESRRPSADPPPADRSTRCARWAR